MTKLDLLTPDEIRATRAAHTHLRDRDFADKFGLAEAQLVAAFVGQGVTPIAPHPDDVIGIAMSLGEVMALTRNQSCVHEKIGEYGNYRSGQHAAMVLNGEIDLRFFPSHWCHAFMVERETEQGVRRSLQVFDAAGDAVHKIFLRDESAVPAWDAAKLEKAIDGVGPQLRVAARVPTETAKGDPGKADVLRQEWSKMTDTHQFIRLVSKLKMNRLGAYRMAGSPFVRRLETGAIDTLLHRVQAAALEAMVFVGNRGCIQIHSGLIDTLRPMGPWQNVMDPRFNLHLRLDQIAEVWAVNKPTKTGPAISVEAFDADGGLIMQTFGIGFEGRNNRPAWNDLVENLPTLQSEEA